MSFKRRRLIGEWLWSEQDRKYFVDGWGEKILWAAKVQLVRYTMWDPNICLPVFFLSGTGNPAQIPKQHHNRVGVATLHKPQGLLTLDYTTMRSEEGSFFWDTKEWFFTHPVRTAVHNVLSGPWYHVRFNARELHSWAEQKGQQKKHWGGSSGASAMPCRVSLMNFDANVPQDW